MQYQLNVGGDPMTFLVLEVLAKSDYCSKNLSFVILFIEMFYKSEAC